MAERSLEQLEVRVERLLNEFSRLNTENQQLREQVAALEAGKAVFRERLDLLISRLDQVATK
jgi:regulator of replication initiation timing